MGTHLQRRSISFLAYLLAFVATLLTLFPVLWIFTISIKSEKDAFALPPVWTFTPVWGNYVRIWQTAGFADAFRNSAIVTAVGVVLALSLGVLAAYALNRLPMSGKRVIAAWLLLAYMLPEFLFVIPMYVLFQKVGLYDTQLGLALAYQLFVLPFAIWLLRGFFSEVPSDLDDAARIDGCSRVGTLCRVYLPLSAPGIAATAILCAIWIWNELTISLALTFQSKTVTVAVAGFHGYASIDWGALTAACLVAVVPMVLFAALAQRYIVSGLTLGAVK